MTGLPSWLWRMIFVSLVLCGGIGLMVYLLFWIVVPKEDAGLDLGTGSFRSA